MSERLSPTAAVARAYERLRAWNDPAMFIHTRDEAEAIAIARDLEADPAGKPLAGLVFAVKDNIDVAGQPTTCHSKLLLDNVAHADATVIGNLRAAGAILLGKLGRRS